MKLFKIIFDNPGESYFAGQVVTGKVLIHLNRPQKVKAIKLRCIGRGEVNWTERSGKTSNNYRCHEPYFNFETILLGEETHDVVIPVGENSYPFHIQLPGGIPSSFQGTHGNIQYFIKATITRPWKFAQKVSSYFTINGFVDLNLFGTSSHPLTVTKRQNIELCGFGFFCSWTSVVGFILSLEKTGFVPGECIKFNIQIQNGTKRVSSIKISLIQIATFRVRGREKYETKVINELRGPMIGARETIDWNSEECRSFFKIPPVPPTNLGGGSIIGLQYYLSVTMTIPTICSSVTVKGQVQLVIGTVPYRNVFEQLMPFYAQSQLTQPIEVPVVVPFSEQGGSSETPQTLDFTSPPPTYAEAMELYNRYGSSMPSPSAPQVDSQEDISIFGEDDEAGEGRSFTPRYATYEWNRHNGNR